MWCGVVWCVSGYLLVERKKREKEEERKPKREKEREPVSIRGIKFEK